MLMRIVLGLILALIIRSAVASPPLGTANQITYNILNPPSGVTPAATCNGDVQVLTRTVSITRGTRLLTTGGVDTFLPGDAGKLIRVPGMDSAGMGETNVIWRVDSPTQVTLRSSSNTTIAAVSKVISFGTSDSAAFAAFKTWALANQGSNQVVLTIPTGANCWFGSNVSRSWAAGIRNLIVEGTGAKLNSIGGSAFQLGGQGIIQTGLTQVGGRSARINSVTAGSTQIELTPKSFSAGYISRFSAGKWIMLGGIDSQSFWQSPYGYPPNNYWFEWRQVTAICNNAGPCAGTATLTLDRPLTNTYLSTWPNFHEGSQFEVDPGGPATIFALPDNWNMTAEYRGMTISQEGQTYALGRNITYRNVTFTGRHGAIPTQNETWSAINSDFGFADMETDKLVGTMIFDGSSIYRITFQSTSTDVLIIRNNATLKGLSGGAKRTYITDSTITNYGTGISAYGNNDVQNETICTRCAIGTFDWKFAAGYIDNDNPVTYSKRDGVIAMPNTAADGSKQRWMVPGAREFFTVGGLFTVGMFKLTGPLTQDPWPALDDRTVTTNVTMDCISAKKTLNVSTSIFASGDVGKSIYINGVGRRGGQLQTWISSYTNPTSVDLGYDCSTSVTASPQTVQWGTSNTHIGTGQSGGFPDLSALSAFPIQMRTLNSAKFTCDACTGDPNIVGMTIQAGATPASPVATFVKRQFTASSVAQQAAMPSLGKFVSLTVDVTQPFVGTGSAVLNPTGQFANNAMTIDQSTWTAFRFFPAINLKQSGKRVIRPGFVTCDMGRGPVARGCAGDSIPAPSGSPLTGGYPPNAVWIANGITPWTAGNFAGMTTPPTFTITMQTDQSP